MQDYSLSHAARASQSVNLGVSLMRCAQAVTTCAVLCLFGRRAPCTVLCARCTPVVLWLAASAVYCKLHPTDGCLVGQAADFGLPDAQATLGCACPPLCPAPAIQNRNLIGRVGFIP